MLPENLKNVLLTLLKIVLLGALLAYLLHLGERFFAWPVGLRTFGGGVLIVIGSLLLNGGSGRVLYQKGAVRGIDERDIAEYKSTRNANLAAGIWLLVIGAVLFASLFVL